jgi:hypothetical protein
MRRIGAAWTPFHGRYAQPVSTAERFWTRRLRWRLLGAWRWPLFGLLTFLDGLIVHWLPPAGARAMLIPALIVCSFANLFLIGAVAPWIARRLAARQGEQPATPTFPPANHVELLTDKVAAAALVLATVGLVAAGLGNRPVVVAATDRLERAGEAAKQYVAAHAPEEIRRNVDALNTYRLDDDGFFRMCVPYDDRLKAFCMFVDADPRPPLVRRDPDTRPNGAVFGDGQ